MPCFLLRSWNCILCKQGSPKGDHCCIWGTIKDPRHFVCYSICSQNGRGRDLEGTSEGHLVHTVFLKSVPADSPAPTYLQVQPLLFWRKSSGLKGHFHGNPLPSWWMAWAYLFHAVTTPDGRISTQEIPHMMLEKIIRSSFPSILAK